MPNVITRYIKRAFVSALAASVFLFPITFVSQANAQSGPNIVASLNFTPKFDGFGFENYTSKEHDGSKDMNAADMVRMFGPAAVCKNAGATAANCVMKASAREWMDGELESMGSGHCEGMAVACLRFNKQLPFKGKRGASDFRLGVKKPFDLELDPLLANYIAYYWATQSLPEVQELGEEWSKKGPLAIVNELIRSMNAGDETYTFGICKRSGEECEEGHAITPFAVEDAGSSYKVHVYDNNDPGETKILTIQKGGKNTWNYVAAINPGAKADTYTGDKTTNSLEIVPTTKREGRCFTAPFDESDKLATGCGIETVMPGVAAKPTPIPTKPTATPKPAVTTVAAPAARPRFADFFLTGDGDMMIVDEKERRLGYDPDRDAYFNEIPGAKKTNNIGGKGFDMPHYNVPFANGDKFYTVVFSGDNLEEESVMDFVFTGPGFSVGLDGIMLDPGEFLVAAFSSDGEKISMEMSKDGEMPEVFYSVDTPKKSFKAEIKPSRSKAAGSVKSAGGGLVSIREKDLPSISIDFTDSDDLQIRDNIDGDEGYDVDIEQFDANGKTDSISLNDVGAGEGGTDAYEIELGRWAGGDKIGVKHDDEGDGFANDDEEFEDDEPNDIPDDSGEQSDLMRSIYKSVGY
ncbi:MAG: hypothetical protein WBO68_04150 [Pyrinomonadaceae bacterium]